MIFTHSLVKQNGLLYVKNNTDKVLLVKNLSASESYTDIAAKIVGSSDVLAADIDVSAVSGDMVLTYPEANGINLSGSAILSDTLSLVLADSANNRLLVSSNITSRALTAGDPVDFPQLKYTIKNPVVAS